MKFFKRLSGNLIFWILWPLIYFVLKNSHRARVILVSGDKLLVVEKWIGRNNYSLPGGGIHTGEESLLAAVRELREETGVEIDPKMLKTLNLNKQIREDGLRYLVDVYFAEVNKELPTRLTTLEILDARWVEWRTLLDSKKLSKGTKELMRAWIDM